MSIWATRNYRHRNYGPTRVTLYWNNTLGMYSLKWADTHNWDKMQECIRIIKQTIPGTERDYSGPPENTWYIHEKHAAVLKVLLENIREFDFEFIAKPEGQTNTVKYTPTDIYIAKFKELTGADVNGMEFSTAKKLYFRASMKYHPDRNNGDSSKMYELNTAWDGLQIQHFKVKQLVTEMTGA